MRKARHTDGMTYVHANFMPDYRFGCFQIGDGLNLFYRRKLNLRIIVTVSVCWSRTVQNRPVKGLLHSPELIVSLFGILLYACASRALDFVSLHQ